MTTIEPLILRPRRLSREYRTRPLAEGYGERKRAREAAKIPLLAGLPGIEYPTCGSPLGIHECVRSLGHEGPHACDSEFLAEPVTAPLPQSLGLSSRKLTL